MKIQKNCLPTSIENDKKIIFYTSRNEQEILKINRYPNRLYLEHYEQKALLPATIFPRRMRVLRKNFTPIADIINNTKDHMDQP